MAFEKTSHQTSGSIKGVAATRLGYTETRSTATEMGNVIVPLRQAKDLQQIQTLKVVRILTPTT